MIPEDIINKAKNHVEKKLHQMKIAAEYHLNYFGHAHEIRSVQFLGKKHIMVSNSLLTSDDPKNDWEFPADFLCSYIKTTLGNDWFESQLDLKNSDRHIIVSWFEQADYKIRDKSNPLESMQMNGEALHLLHLAYDLFVIENHGCLIDHEIKSALLHRLKKQKEFNGARYEIFVFSTLVRAGFKVAIHNQKSLTSVTECTATHLETNTVIQIEAKTRNVKYVLGSSQGRKNKINLYDNLRKAIEKQVDTPYIVFVDINLPYFSALPNEMELKKIRKEYKKLEEKYPKMLPNIVCFTNIPFHYGEEWDFKNLTFGLILSHYPKVALSNDTNIMQDINSALAKYKFLPSIFDESNKHAEKILK